MNNNNYYAPIVIFSYARLDSLKNLIKSIKTNKNYNSHKFYIFSDNYKDVTDKKKVKQVRLYCKKIKLKNKKIFFRKRNYGLAKNIISGISYVIEKHGKAIILEDDLIISKNFLEFMNSALKRYQFEKKIWHITGWSHNLNILKKNDNVYFNRHMICWGWATWEDRWKHFKKKPNKIIKSWKKNKIKEFDQYGVYNNWSQIIRNQKKIINTWAVFWNATIFENKGLCLNPTKSLVFNNGLDSFSTNMSGLNWILRSQRIFNFKVKNFPDNIEENLTIKKYLRKNFSSFSYIKILKKILNLVK